MEKWSSEAGRTYPPPEHTPPAHFSINANPGAGGENRARTVEIQHHAVLPPWANPVQLCTFWKLVRERLHAILARPSGVRLRGRRPERRLELPGGPRPRPQYVSGRSDARGSAPRSPLVLVEDPERDC